MVISIYIFTLRVYIYCFLPLSKSQLCFRQSVEVCSQAFSYKFLSATNWQQQSQLVLVSFSDRYNVIQSWATVVLGRYDLTATANDDGTSRFFIVGDWGGLPTSPYDTPSEVAVADAMGQLGAKLNTTFQLALGDNFYYDGVTSTTDPRFQVRFDFPSKHCFRFLFD